MKVVFVANFPNASASGLQRKWALEQCGVEVLVFNTHKYASKFEKWTGHLAKILKYRRLTYNSSALEKDLIVFCNDAKPDIIWFEWARDVKPSAFKALMKIDPRPFFISFQDDNPWGDRKSDQWMWYDYFKVVPYFDLHLIKRASDIENLKKLGAKACRFWQHGIFSPLYHPLTDQVTEKKFAVSFVGTCMDKDNRGLLIEEILDAGIDIHIFGPLWDKRMGGLVRRYPNNFHPPVWGQEYADVIRQSLISLLLVSNSNKDEWTMRSYEIPGCATAALVLKTPTHEKMFVDGETGFFYDNASRCVEVLKNVLSQPGLAIKVGLNAEKTFKEKGFTLENRMHELLDELHIKYLTNSNNEIALK